MINESAFGDLDRAVRSLYSIRSKLALLLYNHELAATVDETLLPGGS
jgi:hypothetical protein